jgi:hypothetical protein
LSGWTTTLVAGVIEANKPILMYYDGANWDAVQTGTVAAAGSGNTTINGTACALGGSCSPPIQGGPVTTSTYTIANTYSSGIILNTQATTTSSFTVTLPTPAFGKLWCATNFVNSSNVAETGQIELLVANTGTQSIVYKGAVSSSGYVLSTGAAGDYGCVFGASSTQWNFTPSDGTTWGLH